MVAFQVDGGPDPAPALRSHCAKLLPVVPTQPLSTVRTCANQTQIPEAPCLWALGPPPLTPPPGTAV